MESINDLTKLFEEIVADIDINGKDKDFVEIRFTKEEVKGLLDCLQKLGEK